MAEVADPPAAEAAEAPVEAKSALVLGWFFASERQLEFVQRLYKKNGYTDVVVQESPVPLVAKPGGWYKRVLDTNKGIVGEGTEGSPAGEAHPLARKFDVVHVMSGGFLNLYQLLFAGVKIDFNTLVLDSTPILPKPASFTRFARAYMQTVDLKWVPKLVPAKVHLAFVSMKWLMAMLLIKIKHKLRMIFRAVGFGKQWEPPQQLVLMQQQASKAIRGRYTDTIEHTLQTVFGRENLHTIFVYNPEDPFINPTDVKNTMARATELGCKVEEVNVKHDHVQTLFRQPKAIFNAVAAS